MASSIPFHADIFFFISSIGFIALLVFLVIIFVYIVRILAIVQRLGQKLEDEIEAAHEKLTKSEVELKENGIRELFALLALGIDWYKRRRQKKKH